MLGSSDVTNRVRSETVMKETDKSHVLKTSEQVVTEQSMMEGENQPPATLYSMKNEAAAQAEATQ